MPKKILVVDDNPVSRELVRELLESPDLQVLEAEHGWEALERIAEESPDLVLLDIRMPLRDGYEVLSDIRRNPDLKSLRVVAFTANAMRGDRERAIAAGFDDYITKPLDLSLLKGQIERLLS